MNFNQIELSNISPVAKIKRTVCKDRKTIVIEQRKNDYKIFFKFTSPTLNKKRLKLLRTFSFGSISEDTIDEIIGDVKDLRKIIEKGSDPIESEKIQFEQKVESEINLRIKSHENKLKNQQIPRSYSDLWDEFIQLKKFTEKSDETQKAYRYSFEKIDLEFGNRDISNIGSSDIENILDKYPAARSNLIGVVLSLLEKQNNILTDDYSLSPRQNFLLIKENKVVAKKKIILEDSVISKIMNSESTTSNVCKFQLLHGTRVTETCLAEWEQFDLERKLWIIPAKNIKTQRAYKKQDTPHIRKRSMSSVLHF